MKNNEHARIALARRTRQSLPESQLRQEGNNNLIWYQKCKAKCKEKLMWFENFSVRLPEITITLKTPESQFSIEISLR